MWPGIEKLKYKHSVRIWLILKRKTSIQCNTNSQTLRIGLKHLLLSWWVISGFLTL